MVLPGADRTTDPEPELSVIMCTRNGAGTIGRQLDALADQEADFEWELLVVDNGSTDSTIDVVRSHDSEAMAIRIIDAGEKAGLSFARNVGVAHARAESVAFCDDDDVVGPRWVSAMRSALLEHRLVASALEYERLNAPEILAGRARFQATEIESLFGIPVCAGACGVRKDLWTSLGGNDESLTSTGEDFDFSMRANRRAGAVPFFAQEAVYHHSLRDEPGHIYNQARSFGTSHATLWARYGSSRVGTADELRRALRDWWWVVTRAPLALIGRNRDVWLRTAGRRVGRLRGSFRERVVLL